MSQTGAARSLNNHRGVLTRRVDFPGLCIAEIRHSGGPADEHSHDQPHFWLMLHGSYRVECGRRGETVGQNAVVYTAPNQPHRDHMRERDGLGLTVSLNSTLLAEQFGPLQLPADSTIFTSPKIVSVVRLMRAELCIDDASSPVVVAGLALSLLGQVGRWDARSGGEAAFVKRAQAIVEAGYDLAELSVAMIARELSLHPVYLARAFQKTLGCTPSQYIRTHRCERAAEALRTTSLPLSLIAYNCGFGDQSSFTRSFRRTFGMTPGAYRKAT